MYFRSTPKNFEFIIELNKLKTVDKYLGMTFTYSENLKKMEKCLLIKKRRGVLFGKLFLQYKTLGLTHMRNYSTLVSFQLWTIHPVSGCSKNFN